MGRCSLNGVFDEKTREKLKDLNKEFQLGKEVRKAVFGYYEIHPLKLNT